MFSLMNNDTLRNELTLGRKFIIDVLVLDDLKSKLNMTMLFITHDFGVVNDIADEVIVMFKGKIVEQGSVMNVLSKPNHPYTKALLNCVPDSNGKKILKPIDYQQLNKLIGKL